MTEGTPEQPVLHGHGYVIVGRDFSGEPRPRLDMVVTAMTQLNDAARSASRSSNRLWAYLDENSSEALDRYYNADRFGEYLSPDATSVRFSEMNEEAEAEMAEWDAIIKGKRKRPH